MNFIFNTKTSEEKNNSKTRKKFIRPGQTSHLLQSKKWLLPFKRYITECKFIKLNEFCEFYPNQVFFLCSAWKRFKQFSALTPRGQKTALSERLISEKFLFNYCNPISRRNFLFQKVALINLRDENRWCLWRVCRTVLSKIRYSANYKKYTPKTP